MIRKLTREEDLIEYDKLMGQKLSPTRHNENGEELLDPTPMQPPIGYKKTPSLFEQVLQANRVAQLEQLRGLSETEDEADDFEIADDFVPNSEYENDHVPSLAVLKRRAQEINDQIREANNKAAIAAYEKSIVKPKSPAAQPPGDSTLTKEPIEKE